VVAEEPSAPAAPEVAPAPAGVPEYAVKKGDTLWQIANQVRGERQVSVEQVILALYRTNKDAFFGNNVNNLKSGKILKLPESEAIESVSAPEARKEFRAQYDAWQEYKLKLAGSSRAIKLTETDASALAAAEAEAARIAAADKAAALPQDKAKETARPEKKTGPADKGKQDELLKIVRSTLQSEKGAPDKKVAETESAKDAGTRERQALADRAATLEESLESKRLENKELSEKIGMVRSQLKKESRLIELESQSLAQAQKKPAETKAAEPAAKPVPAPVAKVEQPKAAEPVPEKAATPPAPASAKAPEVAKKRVPPPPAPPKEEKGFLAGLLEAVQNDLLMPLLIGVVVLVSGGIALVYFRRRQKSIAEFEESILSADAISGDQPVTTSDTTGHPPAAAATGDTSFLSDFSQGGMGNIHTDEVDPIAEADVYLAYGRDETAEEILKEAVVKHPERHELKLKLLEIYHQRNDVAAFETMAEELYAAQGGRSSKVWDKVEEMGRKLNPDNPMFKGGAPKAGGGSAPSKAAPAMAQAVAPPAAPAPAMDDAADSIDFDLGTPAPAPAAAEPALDFDLGESKPTASEGIDFAGTMKMETAAAEEKSGFEAMELGAPADNSLDFDIGGKIEMPDEISMGEPAAPNEVKWEPQTATAPAELSLETAGAPAAGGSSAQWDETATKLDLAKAYIDMGDAEGARSILQEVISEGNDAQKKQAQELSAQIA